MFDRDLKKFSNKKALIEDDVSITYRELAKRVEELSKKIPLQKQLIAIEMQQTIESIVTYLSAFQQGHTILMVDPTLKNKKKEHIYTRYQPNYIFTQNTLLYQTSKEHPLYKNLALLLPTSGSTGSIKYVRLSKKNIYANTNSIINYLPLSQEDKTLTTLPLYYSYGLSILHTYLQVGATLICTNEPLTSKKFWEIFEQEECTNFNGVPFHYEILSRLKITQKTFPSLHFLTQAGGKLNQRYIEEFSSWSKKHNKLFYIMYGQTEATARISYLDPKKLTQKPNSIGSSIPNGKLFLKNNEIIYKGDNVMLGYASSLEDLQKEDKQQNILHTGDLGRVDADGDFYIIGRLKRFVKIYGNRVNLDEIEQSCKTNNLDVVVVGKENQITIFTKESLENTKIFVLEEYKIYKRVIKIKYIKEFLVTSSGKIDYQNMLELAYE